MASAELLKQIQGGRALKKAVTNDRSAPLVDPGKGGGARGPSVATAPPVGGGAGAGGGPPMGGPPQLGALFAGGMPKLKPTGQSNQGMNQTLCCIE
jgi:WAS/WASL-interacting protein